MRGITGRPPREVLVVRAAVAIEEPAVWARTTHARRRPDSTQGVHTPRLPDVRRQLAHVHKVSDVHEGVWTRRIAATERVTPRDQVRA